MEHLRLLRSYFKLSVLHYYFSINSAKCLRIGFIPGFTAGGSANTNTEKTFVSCAGEQESLKRQLRSLLTVKAQVTGLTAKRYKVECWLEADSEQVSPSALHVTVLFYFTQTWPFNFFLYLCVILQNLLNYQ